MDIKSKILLYGICAGTALLGAETLSANTHSEDEENIFDGNPFSIELTQEQIALANISSEQYERNLESRVVNDGGMPVSETIIASADTSEKTIETAADSQTSIQTQTTQSNLQTQTTQSNLQTQTTQSNLQTQTTQSNAVQSSTSQTQQKTEEKTQETKQTPAENPFSINISEIEVKKFGDLSESYQKADDTKPEEKKQKQEAQSALDEMIRTYITEPLKQGKVEVAIANQNKLDAEYKNNEHLLKSGRVVRDNAVDDILKQAMDMRISIPKKDDGSYNRESPEYAKFKETYDKAMENARLLNVEQNLYKEIEANNDKWGALIDLLGRGIGQSTEKHSLEEMLSENLTVDEIDYYRTLNIGYNKVLENGIESKEEMDSLKFFRSKYVGWKNAIEDLIKKNSAENSKEFNEKRKSLAALLDKHIKEIDNEVNKGVEIYNSGLSYIGTLEKTKQMIEGDDNKITNIDEWNKYAKLYDELKKEKAYFDSINQFWELKNPDGSDKEISFKDITGKLENLVQEAESKRFDYQKTVQALHDSIAKEQKEIAALYTKDREKARSKAVALGQKTEDYIKNYGSEFEKDRADSYKLAVGIGAKAAKPEPQVRKTETTKVEKTVLVKETAEEKSVTAETNKPVLQAEQRFIESRTERKKGMFSRAYDSISEKYKKTPFVVIGLGIGLAAGAVAAAYGISRWAQYARRMRN